MKNLILVLIILFMFQTEPSIADDQQNGFLAFHNGEYEIALRRLQPWAESGEMDAQFYVGLMYDLGLGVIENNSAAVDWYLKSANQGNYFAQLYLGNMYRNGEGISQNFSEAVRWYRKAAKKGLAGAQLNLGAMFDRGLGVEKNEKEAFNWYRLAAEQGDLDAAHNLGNMYYNGEGTIKDFQQAIKWYKYAAENGHNAAQNNLGNMFRDGEGVTKDRSRALRLYQQAAKTSVEARANIGVIYEALNYKIAAYSWYSIALSDRKRGLEYSYVNKVNLQDVQKWREELSMLMTPDEIILADILTQHCIANEYDTCRLAKETE